jgi:anion-transporting  ArsA/GET3 family ATPase
VPSGLDKSLLIVSGKGGAGKSTVAAAAAVAAARRGKRVLIVEVGDEEHIPPLFGLARKSGYAGSQVAPPSPGVAPIWSMCITAPEALREYALMSMKFEMFYEAIFRNRAMRFFTAAAPGLDELTIMGKIEFQHRTSVAPAKGARFDLLIFDAPPTGQALAFFKVPLQAMSMARVGPLHAKAARMWKLVTDRAASGFHIVTLPEEMSVSEAIELRRAASGMGLPVGKMVVNGLYPDLFPGEAARLAQELGAAAPAVDPVGTVKRAALNAALWSATRADAQRESLERLAAALPIDFVRLPFLFPPRTGRADLDVLARGLDGL